MSGKYWFDSIVPGIPVFAQCDMKTEGKCASLEMPTSCNSNNQKSHNSDNKILPCYHLTMLLCYNGQMVPCYYHVIM